VSVAAMGLAALDREALHTVLNPYFNQTWGFFALPFTVVLGWWVVQPDIGRRARQGTALLLAMFAIVLVSVEDPEKIVAVRNGPPIVIGLGKDEFFVASDVPPILQHTRDVFFLGDGEIAVLTKDSVRVTDFEGNSVEPHTQRITWDPIMAEKGGFKHFMLKEIYEQPRAVRDTVQGRVSLDTGRVY